MKSSLLSLLVATMAGPLASAADNILVIIMDDLGADSFALTNDDPGAQFPIMTAVESLATQGVLFTNAYASPTCSPTRTTILTGRYGFRTGVTFALTGDDSIPSEEYLIPEILAEVQPAYATANIGKWHLGPGLDDPAALGGWQHFSGALAGAVPDFYAWPKVVNGVLLDAAHPDYATEDNVDDALAWIGERESADPTAPWLLWLAFNAPHTPYHRPPEGTYTPPSPDLLNNGAPGSILDRANRPDAYFRAMAESMDRQIGRLLAEIDLADTHVILLGDNGTPGQTVQPPYTATHAKGTVYEGGVRVPMIVAGPAVVGSNRTSEAMVHSVDLFSTILEMAGVDPATTVNDRPIDSRSILPLLGDPALLTHRGNVFSEVNGGSPNPIDQKAMRDDRYKLIQLRRGGDGFYDLANDPNETTNLLDGTLTPDQQAAYDLLSLKMDLLVNGFELPAYTSVDFNASGVVLTLPPTEALDLTLQFSPDLADWQDTGVAPVVTTAGVTFTYPLSPAPAQLYLRVAGTIEGL